MSWCGSDIISPSPQLSVVAVLFGVPAQSTGAVDLSHPTISNAISRSFFI